LDQILGTISSYKEYIKKDGTSTEDPWNFKSEFTTTAADAIRGFKEFAVMESQETNVLLKNVNDALPLSKTAKITMLGFRSYAPVYGNSGGSIADKNTIDLYQTQIYNCFKERGFQLNPVTTQVYADYISQNNISWGGSGFGAVPPEYKNTAITNGVYELGMSELLAIDPDLRDSYQNYDDAAIVVVGRPGGESKNYTLDPFESTTGTIMGLSTKEKEIIAEAKNNFDKVIVLVNSVTTMEIKELRDDPEIDAIMWIGYPGAYGFLGVADNLNGTVAPSAYLTDTHVTNALAMPAMQNFGNATPWNLQGVNTSGQNVNSYLVYAEGIYSGYRYYETRYNDIVYGVLGAKTAKAGTWTNKDGTISTTDGVWSYEDEVVYPFGYGLSYTTFTEKFNSVTIAGDRKTAEVKVTVTNTGDVAGKHAVRLFVQTPYTEYDKANNVEKSAIQLIDFEKTSVLQPGKSQVVTLYVDMANLASYDYTTAKTFIVDAGDYYFSLGNGAHDALNNVLAAQGKTTQDGMTYDGDASKTYKWTWDQLDVNTFAYDYNGVEITNRLSEGDYAMDINSFLPGTVRYMTRQNWNGTFPTTVSGLGDRATDRMKTLLLNDFIEFNSGETPDVKFGQPSDLNLVDLKGAEWDDPRWEELANKVTIDEFLNFAANAFHHIEEIPSVGFPDWNADDGPGGSDTHYLNEGTYQGNPYPDAADYATSKPGTRVAPAPQNLAATFNKELAFRNGEIIIGETSLILQLPIIIGPGMNLHRHGWNGRGGEYYSEDPILSGFTGSNVVQGAQSKGALVNIKHAAFNDQEINRSGIAVFMNEQTARELELRNLRQAFTAKGKPASFVQDETRDELFTEGALGVMTSYNRIGIVASSANKGVCVDIMRNEWGFKGYSVTDFTGVSPKAAPKESILYGTTAFCGFGSPSVSYWNADFFGGDKELAAAVHTNIKYILYSLAQSNALNGLSSNYDVITRQNNTWWRTTYKAAIAVGSVATVASIALTVVFTFLKKKEEA
jgi:beta-glucosidase